MVTKLVPARRFWVSLVFTAGLAVAAACLLPLAGSAHIDYSRALSGLSPDAEILFYARLPRVLLALLAGGALAVTGTLFQALLRDALAEPYTLGVSSGASLGAVITISMGWKQIAGLPAIWIAAFLGAAVVLALVLWIATEGRRMSSFTLLLAGERSTAFAWPRSCSFSTSPISASRSPSCGGCWAELTP
jgi:iron complex transport system permease protein